jgi:glycosyltransferase involved in cell wall biosynthesis
MKIAIVGTRGIPAKYGGFETFAEEVSIRLVNLGFIVEVYGETNDDDTDNYEGVKLYSINYFKTSNPLLYYRNSIRMACLNKCDIILCCGVGGSPFIYFFKKLFNNIFIINTDGIEYKRTKLNFFKRKFVELCEYLSICISDYIIADSFGIKQYMINKYKKIDNKLFQIEYGANVLDNNIDLGSIEQFNLEYKDYYLIVARLEPENNILMIIQSFLKSETRRKLVIIGNLLENKYVKNILCLCENSLKIIFLNGIYDKMKLQTLRQGAYAYLHGHSVGGTNPSLLEAMGAGNIIIAHDNIFNREVTDNSMFYFDSIESCLHAINNVDSLDINTQIEFSNISKERIKNYYNWNMIAEKYSNMFYQILS